MCMQAHVPCRVLGLASAPLSKEFMHGSHTAAPSPGMGSFFHILPLPENQSLMARAGHHLSEPLIGLGKFSLWIFPGWHWEEPCSYIITRDGGRMLSPLPSQVFSLGQTCSHCTVSRASTSPAISLHHHSLWPLIQSAVALTLCSQKCWLGQQWWQLLHLESLGHPLLGVRQVGRLLLTHTHSPHFHPCTHSLTFSLTL